MRGLFDKPPQHALVLDRHVDNPSCGRPFSRIRFLNRPEDTQFLIPPQEFTQCFRVGSEHRCANGRQESQSFSAPPEHHPSISLFPAGRIDLPGRHAQTPLTRLAANVTQPATGLHPRHWVPHGSPSAMPHTTSGTFHASVPGRLAPQHAVAPGLASIRCYHHAWHASHFRQNRRQLIQL